MANKTPEEIEGALIDANASARARASVRSHIAANDGALADARARLAAAEALQRTAPYEAREAAAKAVIEASGEVRRREEWGRELAAKDRLAAVAKFDAKGAEARKAEIMATHAKMKAEEPGGNTVTGPLAAGNFLAAHEAELALCDKLIAAPTTTPAPDATVAATKAADRATYETLCQSNPIRAASFADAHPHVFDAPEGT